MARKASILKSIRLLISRFFSHKSENKRSLPIAEQKDFAFVRRELESVRREYFEHGKMLAEGYNLQNLGQGRKIFAFLSDVIKNARRGEKQPYQANVIMSLVIAYYEKGSLLRMMNCFLDAKKAFDEAIFFVDSLLEETPDNLEFLALKSQILFRQGELAECQGPAFYWEAKNFYQKSLKLDLFADNSEGSKIKRQLIFNLASSFQRTF
ncbi:MAG: hypothetical protein WC719_00705 [Patescibacteria group bacterium]|jgi:tetratricopeptide (TPR) repeat protein